MYLSANSRTLLIDAGNSYLKWAVSHDQVLSHHGAHEYHRGASDYGIKAALLDAYDVRIDCVVIGSVASESIEQALAACIVDLFSVRPSIQQVNTEDKAITVAYPDASQLGVDRWLAMLGARSLHPGAFCVADCGTALTLDCVDANGLHRGGVIVPGSGLMQQALLSNAAKIDQTEQPLPQSIFANHTGGAVNAGSHYAQAAVLDRFVRESGELLGCSPLVVVTGGGRQSLIKYCLCDVVEVPDLVLIGLGIASGALEMAIRSTQDHS